MSKYIDLSVTINPQTPVYPGDPPVKVVSVATMGKDGYSDHTITLGTHAGTHIDAPMHMVDGGQSLDEIATSHFVGRGQLIDATNGFSLGALQKGNLQTGDIVLFYTGMAKHWSEPAYFEAWPAMTPEMAKYLSEQQVSMVGFDTAGADVLGSTEIHKTLLGGGVLIIENLTNLNQLMGKTFTVYALPIKLQVDGAPARVVAKVEQ